MPICLWKDLLTTFTLVLQNPSVVHLRLYLRNQIRVSRFVARRYNRDFAGVIPGELLQLSNEELFFELDGKVPDPYVLDKPQPGNGFHGFNISSSRTSLPYQRSTPQRLLGKDTRPRCERTRCSPCPHRKPRTSRRLRPKTSVA